VYEIKSINKRKTKQPLVVKFLRSTLYENHGMFAASAADLIKEGNILSTLNHRNVIGLRGVSSSRGIDAYLNGYHDSFYLVLERLETTLSGRILEWKARHKELYQEDEMCYNINLAMVKKGHSRTNAGMDKFLKKLSKLRVKSSSSNRSRESDLTLSTISDSEDSSSRDYDDDTSLIVFGKESKKLEIESLRMELLDERIDVTLQLADALAYLHQHNVLHRDLKPDNIGFDREGVIKVFDFDIARVAPTSTTEAPNNEDELFHMTQKVGSPRYMSPECALREPYNKKTDVYTYGLLFHEIMTLEKPYEDIDDEEHEECVFYEGVRPHIIDMQLPKRVKITIAKTWSVNIEKRPTMKTVRSILKKERTEILRLGIETDANSSTAMMLGERNNTSYVTSCAFESMSDNNPKYKKMIKVMMKRINKRTVTLNNDKTQQRPLFCRFAKAA